MTAPPTIRTSGFTAGKGASPAQRDAARAQDRQYIVDAQALQAAQRAAVRARLSVKGTGGR